jgi:hypothetical protein
MEDPRFRGVLLLLATMLPLADANALREILLQRAADTKDHILSDSFIQALRARAQNGAAKVAAPNVSAA